MDVWDLYRFTGRTGRLSFALTQIGVFTFSYVAIFLLIVLSGAGDEAAAKVTWQGQATVTGLGAMLLANLVWLSLAASVRRCHDRDLSGWMLLFVMPPLLGQLWLVLSLVTGEGTRGPNRHGRREPSFPYETTGLSQRAALA
ncbi:MAG: DUF805 domain-containing protein [Caulobacter sp.]|nr:DUF805 domain-containing protein [Caulobacter sp.]